jgi:hypothetical protein
MQNPFEKRIIKGGFNRGKQYRQIENDCQFRIGARKREKHIADLHSGVSRAGHPGVIRKS